MKRLYYALYVLWPVAELKRKKYYATSK